MGAVGTIDGPAVSAEAAGPPTEIAGMKLIRSLARGGFAEVWEAEQVSLGRRVAVKILRSELLGQEQMVALFEQESRVLARLNHPNVVNVIDRGKAECGPYFVMEFIDGPTLQELLTQGKLSRERALHILMQAARGLAYAHRSRVVHRDVKPANILIGHNGHVKIGDFGIAAVKKAAGECAPDTGPTGKSLALGTRAFMAPEQRSAFDEVGPSADVYSLGVILHRILTGRLPRVPGQVAEDVTLPEGLREIVEKALSSAPSGRYPDAGAFREALVNRLEGRHLDDRAKDRAKVTVEGGRFELLDVIRQDERRSVYLVRRGGAQGEKIVVKRYVKDPEALRIVRDLVRIDHPNIVRIHAVGEREDAFIMLMEHLPGGDLRERLVQPHSWLDVVRVGRDVAAALAHAHRHGIVHGNLRPSNVLFDEKGGIRVTDFGLPEHYVGEDKRNWYAPPEGGRTKGADLWALGSILFEMLYAMPVPETAAELATVLRDRRHDVPERLLAIVGRLLAPAEQRYSSADPVRADLEDQLGAEVDRMRQQSPAPSDAAVAPAGTATPRVAYGPALLGLGGLLFVWILQLPFVQDTLEAFFSR